MTVGRQRALLVLLVGFTALAFAYGLGHWNGSTLTLIAGVAALAACLALFACTAMIYACIKFLQEWASPFTLANFVLMGCATLVGQWCHSFALYSVAPSRVSKVRAIHISARFLVAHRCAFLA